MDANGNQWVMTTRSWVGSGHTNFGGDSVTVQRWSQFHDDECIAHIGSVQKAASDTVNQLSSFVSMDSDGFTINLSAAGHDTPSGHVMTVMYLALKPTSGNVSCGVGTQGDTSVSVGFAPDGMIFGSVQQTNDTLNAVDCHACVGMADGLLNKNAWEGTESSPGTNQACPPSYAYWSSDSVMRFTNTAQTLLARATATLDGSGASLTWTTDDAAARLFGWMAFQVDDGDQLPIVETLPATDIQCEEGTLNGLVTANTNDGVNYYFEWGPTISYGFTTSVGTAFGFSPTAVSALIGGIVESDEIHFRLVVVGPCGDIPGEDESFIEGGCSGPTGPAGPMLNDEFSL